MQSLRNAYYVETSIVLVSGKYTTQWANWTDQFPLWKNVVNQEMAG